MVNSRTIEKLCSDKQSNRNSSMKTITMEEKAGNLNSQEVNLASHQLYLEALVQVERYLLTFNGESECYSDILQTLGSVCKVSRVYVCENHRSELGELLMSQKAEWCVRLLGRNNDNPSSQSLSLENLSYEDFFPRWIELLANGEPFSGIVTDFPESERKILASRGVLSTLILPIFTQGEFFGFIGFDNCEEAKFGNPQK
ncbi:MAG: hypothetical protein HC908_11180 [Calothrix sp. SM1_7_51]|nr:hypothetical protein [Calothrix sp. SM1_7_51]